MAQSTRIPSNTNSLKERFPERYREFFAKHDLIISAPGSFYLVGEHSARYGAPAVTLKLPIRLYVGFRPIREPRVELEMPAYYYFPDQQAFRPFEPEPPTISEISAFLTECWQRMTERRGLSSPGYAVTYLSELPSGRGFSPSGAFAAACSVGLHLLSGQLNTERLIGWQRGVPPDAIFDHIFRLGWQLEHLLHTNPPDGSMTLSSLASAQSPILYFSEDRRGDLTHHEGARFPLEIGDRIELIDQIPYYATTLAERFGIEDAAFPLDLALVSVGSGLKPGLRSGHRLQAAMRERFASTGRAVQSLLRGVPVNSRFLRRLEEPAGLMDAVVDVMASASVSVIHYCQSLLRGEITPEVVYDFSRMLGAYYHHSAWLGLSTPELHEARGRVIEAARRKRVYPFVGVKLSGAGRKSDLLVVSLRGAFREELLSVVDGLKRDFNGQAFLDYASWLDGYGEEGVKLEQWLERGKVSPIVAERLVAVSELDETGELKRKLVLREELPQLMKAGLVVSLEEQKILINGRPLTSKDLHSAKATIRLLSQLAACVGQSVESQRLEVLPYSSDRTELQSKLVSPLQRSLERRLGYRLPIAVSGQLTTFTVTLKPGRRLVMVGEEKR